METPQLVKNMSIIEWNVIFYGRELGITWLSGRDGELGAYLWEHIKDLPEARGKEIKDFAPHLEENNQMIVTLASPGEKA